MSDEQHEDTQGGPQQIPLPGQMYEPSKKDRMKPAELLIFSGVLALFVGLVVLMSTREWLLSGVFLVGSFIVVVVVIALFSLSFKPKQDEVTEIHDQDEKNEGH